MVHLGHGGAKVRKSCLLDLQSLSDKGHQMMHGSRVYMMRYIQQTRHMHLADTLAGMVLLAMPVFAGKAPRIVLVKPLP